MSAQSNKDEKSTVSLYSNMSDNSALREIQLACYEILKRFVSVCEANNLRYYLGYGTLLGAIRHNGFIPWDDDIDVWMPRPDMEFFLKNCHEEMLPYKIGYYNQETRTCRSQPCIKNLDFQVGTNAGGKIKKTAIFIDIMPLDGMPKNTKVQKIHCMWFRFWYTVTSFARSSINGAHAPESAKGLKKIGIRLNEKLKIGKLLNFTECMDAFEKLRTKYSFDASDYVIGATTVYIDKAVFPKSWITGTRKQSYEDGEFSIPTEAEKILAQLYGNYMVIPPLEKRTTSHIIVSDLEAHS